MLGSTYLFDRAIFAADASVIFFLHPENGVFKIHAEWRKKFAAA
jgi:hypothetical protein